MAITPSVLVTGATGFIGGAAAAQLLLAKPICRVLLLVRGETADAAKARAWRSLTRFVDPENLRAAWPRCEIIHADLTQPEIFSDKRLAQVTHVLHLAANTSFRSVRAVRHTNILGTLGLAHRMREATGLARFLYVGTAYICGAQAPAVVCEDSYPDPAVRHLAEYTASKAECELLLERTAPELPLIVARPSVVIGHTRLGCAPSASLFWYYRVQAMLRRTFVPLSARRDIIPVDYAATALLALLFKARLQHRRYHISAGQVASVTWREIADEFDRCVGVTRGDPYAVTDVANLAGEMELLRQRLGPGDEQLLLQAVASCARFTRNGAEIFDNRRLLAEGVVPPPPFTKYLRQCIAMPPHRTVYDQMRDDGWGQALHSNVQTACRATPRAAEEGA